MEASMASQRTQSANVSSGASSSSGFVLGGDAATAAALAAVVSAADAAGAAAAPTAASQPPGAAHALPTQAAMLDTTRTTLKLLRGRVSDSDITVEDLAERIARRVKDLMLARRYSSADPLNPESAAFWLEMCLDEILKLWRVWQVTLVH